MIIGIIFFLVGSTVAVIQAVNKISIYEVLHLCEKNEVGEFDSIISHNGVWEIKAHNLNNPEKCEMKIDQITGIIEYSLNVAN
jgi:ribose 5-phosphate isomerase